MPEVRSKYMRILKIELEDLVQDIAALVEFYEQKRSGREITNYVYLENVSLIQHEVSCLKELLHELDRVDVRRYPDLPALVREIERILIETGRGGSLPDSIGAIVRRRIEKTTRYVLEA